MQTSLNFRKEPYVLLLFTTIILLFALAFKPLSNFDFQDKVMFGVPLDNMVWIIPCFLLAFWFVYLATKNYLHSTVATWVHIISTVVTTLLLVSIMYVTINPTPIIAVRYELIGNIVQIVTLLFILGQFVYFGNIALGLFKRQKAV